MITENIGDDKRGTKEPRTLPKLKHTDAHG